VDEADLLAIMAKNKQTLPATPAPVETVTEPTPEPEPMPEPKKNNTTGLLAVLLIFGALGGGAYYYFKVLKPKQGTKKAVIAELDEFAFDEDEEDFDSAVNYEPESAAHEGGITEETAEPDNDNDGFSFDLGDFETETTESESRE
jgi:uncharacterized protein HemX